MPEKAILQLRFPSGGLDKRLGYSDQAPGTTGDALNVRPIDALEGRERGGSRPGYGKAFPQQMGPSGDREVRLLDTLSYKPSDGTSGSYSDQFDTDPSLDGFWTVASWVSDGFPLWRFSDIYAASGAADRGMVGTALLMDLAKEYIISASMLASKSATGDKLLIWARLDDTTPDADTDGLIFEIEITNAATMAWAGELDVFLSGSGKGTPYAFTTGTAGAFTNIFVSISITGANVVVKINNTTVLTQTLSGAEASGTAGEIFGIGFAGTGGNSQYLIVQYFANQGLGSNFTRLAAMAGGDLYFEYSPGILEQVGSESQELFTGTGALISSAERVQKLYIADRGDILLEGTDGLLSTTTFDDVANRDWAALGVDRELHVLEIFDATGDAQNGVYRMAVPGSTSISLVENSLGTADTCSYRIRRGPKVFDPLIAKANALAITVWVETLYTATDVADGLAIVTDQHKGSIPLNCPIVTRYKDRMVLCKDHQWHMSRVGDPHDWDYFQADDDTARAVAGQNSDAGDFGQEITAAIAFSDNYLIFAHTNELWLLRGDPAYGGSMDNLSYTVGCVDQFAWTYTSEDDLVFLSSNGLYSVKAGAGGISKPKMLSREVLPQELTGVNKSQTYVSMAYDISNRGIHIYLTPVQSGSGSHWWFSLQTNSFWPVTIGDDNVQPTRAIVYDGETQSSAVFLGSKDGYVRKQDNTFTSDDGTAFSSHVYLGPILLAGDEDMEGLIASLMCILGESSSEVDWTIYTGDTAEEALKSTTAQGTGEWTAGRNVPELRPQGQGVVAFIKIANGAVTAWEFERLRVELIKGGRTKAL